jgi:hypothetical protein
MNGKYARIAGKKKKKKTLKRRINTMTTSEGTVYNPWLKLAIASIVGIFLIFAVLWGINQFNFTKVSTGNSAQMNGMQMGTGTYNGTMNMQNSGHSYMQGSGYGNMQGNWNYTPMNMQGSWNRYPMNMQSGMSMMNGMGMMNMNGMNNSQGGMNMQGGMGMM